MVRASGSDRALADEVLEALEARLERAGVETLRPPPNGAPRVVTDPVATLTAAAEAYQRLRLDEAVAALGGLAEAAADSGGEGFTTASLVELWVLSAATSMAIHDPSAADLAVGRALAVDPALDLDPALWPPPVLEAVERRRVGLATCSLSITVEPRDAVVVVDGREIAASQPATVACGAHLIHARALGYVTTGRELALVPGEPTEVALLLDVDAPAMLAAPGAPYDAVAPSLTTAARALGAELVVLDVARSADGAARGRLVGAGRDASARAADADADVLARRLLGEEEATTEVDPWPWVGVGVAVVAAIAGGIALGVALQPGPSGFDVRGSVAP